LVTILQGVEFPIFLLIFEGPYDKKVSSNCQQSFRP